jgi:hypothetical protein
VTGAQLRRLEILGLRATRSCRCALVALVALVAHSSPAGAQVPNLVDLSAQYTPQTDVGDSHAHAQISSYRLTLAVPIPLSRRHFLVLGGSYHLDTVAYTSPMSVGDHRTLRAPGLSASLIQLLAGRWALVLRAGASLAGDFESVDRRMLSGSVMALVTRRVSSRLSVGGGALVTAGFGHLLPLPAALLNWKPIDNVFVEAFLPAFVKARYTAWNRIEVGTLIDITGSSYAIRDPHIAARWPCAAQATDDPMTTADETIARPGACLDHVSYTVASASLLAGVRLTSTLWLTAFGGLSFYRHAEQQSASGDALEGGEQSLPAALFLRANLTWRIPRS